MQTLTHTHTQTPTKSTQQGRKRANASSYHTYNLFVFVYFYHTHTHTWTRKQQPDYMCFVHRCSFSKRYRQMRNGVIEFINKQWNIKSDCCVYGKHIFVDDLSVIVCLWIVPFWSTVLFFFCCCLSLIAPIKIVARLFGVRSR